MNEEQQITWLRRLRENLRQGNTEQLASNAEKMGLDALLDPAFLTLARQHNAHQVVILIATLGQANGSNTAEYDRLLASFQLITGQVELEAAAKICAQGSKSAIAFYLELLKTVSNPTHVANFDRTPAGATDLEFAIGLVVDCARSDMVLNLMTCWQKIDRSDIPWLKTCKALATRIKEVTLRPEAHKLALTLQEILEKSPVKQAKVKKEMSVQWATIALKSQDPQLSLTAAKFAYKEDASMNQRMNLAKALILNKSFDLATEQIETMLSMSLDENSEQQLENQKPAGAFNTQAAEQTLITINNLLKNKGLKPFIMSGTLLGYQRDRALLPHDKDIDFGIIGWENQFTIAQALIETGFFKFDLTQLTGKNRFLISAYDLRNGMAVDFFMFHDQGDHYLHGIDFDIAITQNFKFSKFDLLEIDFLGDRFYAPSNIEKNLRENYGDWEKPVSSYVVTVESPALCPLKEGKNLLAYLEILKTINKRMNPERIRRILNHIQEQKSSDIPSYIIEKLEKWCKNQQIKNSTPPELTA